MAAARPKEPLPWRLDGVLRQRATLPSWLISLVLHLSLMILLGVTLKFAPPRGAAAERTAEVGIVLKHQDGDVDYFEGPDDGDGSEAPASTATATGSLDQMLDDLPPADPSTALPSVDNVLGLGGMENGGVGGAAQAMSGPPGGSRGIGGKARTGIFGIEGEGYKFVYVFDRSGSMGGTGRSPLSAAKAQLIASLESLEKTHQFQIIFYNERPWIFNPTGTPGRLVFANEQNKTLASKFVRSITADGATRHEDALLKAISLQPDVIFFLTDADEPKLWPGQLAKIRRRANGITINAIEFGFGPQADADNFLVQLARQNGGKHGYVDISKLYPVGQP